MKNKNKKNSERLYDLKKPGLNLSMHFTGKDLIKVLAEKTKNINLENYPIDSCDKEIFENDIFPIAIQAFNLRFIKEIN